MNARILVVAMMAGAPLAHAADLDAGRVRVTTVCAACHGANGVSVAASIPNLAGQKADYLAAQLKAFRSGDRKDDLMNAVASQLGDADIEDLSGFLAALPAASSSTEQSALLPAVATSRVTLPADFRASFTRYLIQDFPDRKQVRHYYANVPALEAARSGTPLPAGSVILFEVFSGIPDEQGKPRTDDDGHLSAGELLGYGAMEKQAGWGATIPEMLRNDDWNYAPLTAEGAQRPGFNQAVCLACHKPRAGDSHLFTLKELGERARRP